MFYIRWIKDACVFMSVHLRSGQWFHPPPFFPPSLSSPFSALQSHLHVSRSVCLSLWLLSLSSVLLRLSPSCQCSAVPASVHSLGSTGSETVTQSSLVIGHGHANQTGRNLQLIRILPPAIIVPRQTPLTPHPDKINYIRGSIPTIGFPVLKLHYRRGKNPKTTQPSYFFNYRKTSHKRLRKHRQTSIYPALHPDRELLAA